MSKITYFFWLLFHPRFWVYTGQGIFDTTFDVNVNHLLDEGTQFTNIDEFEADFGPYRFWINNYPYASFTTKVYVEGSSNLKMQRVRKTLRPSRRTMLRLKNALVKQEPGMSFLFD